MIDAERTWDGGWSLALLGASHRVHRTYYGYTKREAMKMFRQYVKEQGY
jgi:hypothetical protein